MDYKCLKCGKTYSLDIEGNWQKDGTQQTKTTLGVKSTKFCSYECGKEFRKEKFKKTWQAKTKKELDNIVKARLSNRKSVKCVVCGTSFISKNGNTPLCSDECRKVRFSKLPVSGIRECAFCKKEYSYIQGQGSWNKNEELVNVSGKGHEFVIKSHKYCSYSCGQKDKEQKRQKTNLEKYNYISPFENATFRDNLFEKRKREGTLFVSKGENEIKTFVESLGYMTEKFLVGDGKTKNNPRLEIDVYIPELKIGIEYNGVYFHSMNGKKEGRIDKKYHFNKSTLAKERDIEIIHVWEDQWENNKELVKDILCARLKKISKSRSIYARQCIVREISTEEYKLFTNRNHIQGYRGASVKIGLFYKNELVQIASFGKTHNMGKANKVNKEFDYEWIRGCPASNNIVIGGTSKLFSYFVKKYNPNTVLCYADWNLFNGQGYSKCGFEFIGFTGPDKFYVQAKPIQRINRNPYKYKEYMQKVTDKKLWLCYGAGSLKFKWEKIIE